jgi:ribonuclease Z
LKQKRRIKKSAIKKYNLPNSPLLKDLQNGKDIVWQGKKISAKANTFVEESKKLAFILDTRYNEGAIEIAKDADVLVCESTFTENEREKANEANHLTAKDAATIAKKAKVKKLALTHISQRYEHNTKFIEKEAKAIFKQVILPKDLDVIEI